MKNIITLSASFAIYILSLAQAPQKFNYQGVARGATGKVFSNQPLGFKLSILQGSSTGSPVYVEIQSSTSDSKGIFSMEVGTGAVVSGNFSSINWGANTYWLKTEMDTTGGSNYQTMGTTQMISVPYALYSNSAGNAGFANVQVFSTAGTFTFTIPPLVSKIMVEVWGGGGGGGGIGRGGGGGAGGYGKEILSVVSGTTYTVTVGNGGIGGASGVNGTNGGTTSFGSVSATGGNGGGITGTYDGGAGGTSSATINISGGQGQSYGDNQYLFDGGDAGGGGGGGGKYGDGSNSIPTAGISPAGGGGGYGQLGTSGNAGSGAVGRVIVWW